MQNASTRQWIWDQCTTVQTIKLGTVAMTDPAGKRQASSTKLFNQQATSVKRQAASFKRQATSVKLQDPRTTVKFHGARTEGLNADEGVVWMLYMKANLMW